jgi:hypothetical protein
VGEVALKLDGDLGDGLEDPVAVPALLEVVVQLPGHPLPEGSGSDPAHLVPTHHGKGAAPGRDVDENGRGPLVLGNLPRLEVVLGATVGIVRGLLVDDQADSGPGVPARLRQAGRDLLSLGRGQEAPTEKGSQRTTP